MANSFKEAAEKKRLEAEKKKQEEAAKKAAEKAESDQETSEGKEPTPDSVEPVIEVEEPTEVSEEESSSVSLESLIGPATKTQKPKKKTVAVYFSEENHKWLKKEADRRGKSVSAVLDEIIEKLRG